MAASNVTMAWFSVALRPQRRVTMAGYTYSMYTIQPLSSDNNCGATDAHELPTQRKTERSR